MPLLPAGRPAVRCSASERPGLVDGTSRRPDGVRDCSAARTPAAVAARVVPQPVAQSGADGHVRLTAGLVEAEMAAGEHSSIHRMLR